VRIRIRRGQRDLVLFAGLNGQGRRDWQRHPSCLASALSYKTVENFGVSVDVHMTGPDAALVTAPRERGRLRTVKRFTLVSALRSPTGGQQVRCIDVLAADDATRESAPS
jgi:hypothetical protein